MTIALTPTTADWLRGCEYHWYVSEVLGIEPRGLVRTHRDRGSLFHSLMEHALRRYHETGDVYTFDGEEGWQAARAIFLREQRRGVTSTEETAAQLLEAVRWHLPRLGIDKWEILTTEDDDGNEVPLIEHRVYAYVNGYPLSTKVDLVFRHKDTGVVWDVDWKSTDRDVAERSFVLFDYQLLMHRAILRGEGIDVDVSALCQLRSLAPQPPKLIKNGTAVSRNKAELACTWELYERAIIDTGGDPEDYAAMRPVLDAKVFSRWLPDATPPGAEEHMLADLARWCERAEEIERTGEALRRLGYTCRKCDYQKWCSAAMVGEEQTLLSTEYKLREGRSLPVVGQELFDPRNLYVDFLREHGVAADNIDPFMEFKP